MPLPRGVLHVDAILRVDPRHDGVTDEGPGLLVQQQARNFHVDRDAAVLHRRRHRGKLSPMQHGVQVHSSLPQQPLQQRWQADDVAHAVFEDLRDFLRAERAALQDALAHRVLVLLADRIEPEMAQSSDQALAFGWHDAAVDVAAEHRRQIEHLCSATASLARDGRCIRPSQRSRRTARGRRCGKVAPGQTDLPRAGCAARCVVHTHTGRAHPGARRAGK